ncbi:MAG: hypothetical protein FWD41_05530, partial [Actinomycetia bacterium]|nr:hypothetical protein [Actinomycetes bacterium]
EFSLNEAPTLRVVDLSGQDIDSSGVADLAEYDANIGTLVQEANLIDAMAGPLRNAPGYNNFDINYLADRYLVTVNDSFATNSGAGAYTAGSTVTIDAGTRTGYRFVGWTVDSGNATLANPDSPITTFVMPADHVVVTAHWEADQPDPGPDPDPVDPDKPDQPDPNVPDTGDSNGGVLLLSSALVGIGVVTIPVLRAKKSMAF